MWNDNKTEKLSYLGWSCILHIGAMLLIILSPTVEDLDSEKVEITFQVAGEGATLGSKKGDSLDSLKAKSAPIKNELNDSLLSELESEVSKGASKQKAPKLAAAKATNTQAESQESSSLEQELDNTESITKEAPAPIANTLAEQPQADFANNTTDAEESGLRNLVKKSPISAPRQQVLGKRSFKANRVSTLGKKRNALKRENILGKTRSSFNRKSAFGKRTTNTNRNSSLGQKRTASNKTNVFKKRSSKANRKSALGQSRNSFNKNRNSVFGKRDAKARAASMFARNSNSNAARPSGVLGSRNQSGTRTGSALGRGNKGNSNKTRTASALGNANGRSKRSYGNAFGRGGAGSGRTFGLPKGIRDARSLKQIAGNPVPSYPYHARVRKNQGVVYLVYYVDSFGKVSRIKIHRSSGFSILDKSAQKAIARYRYYKGQSGYVIHPVEFTLNGTVKIKVNGKSSI